MGQVFLLGFDSDLRCNYKCRGLIRRYHQNSFLYLHEDHYNEIKLRACKSCVVSVLQNQTPSNVAFSFFLSNIIFLYVIRIHTKKKTKRYYCVISSKYSMGHYMRNTKRRSPMSKCRYKISQGALLITPFFLQINFYLITKLIMLLDMGSAMHRVNKMTIR